MPLVKLDARVAELAYLDVIGVRNDGSLYLDATFVAKCLAAYGVDPRTDPDAVVREEILARAAERRHAPKTAPARLASAALNLGAPA